MESLVVVSVLVSGHLVKPYIQGSMQMLSTQYLLSQSVSEQGTGMWSLTDPKCHPLIQFEMHCSKTNLIQMLLFKSCLTRNESCPVRDSL